MINSTSDHMVRWASTSSTGTASQRVVKDRRQAPGHADRDHRPEALGPFAHAGPLVLRMGQISGKGKKSSAPAARCAAPPGYLGMKEPGDWGARCRCAACQCGSSSGSAMTWRGRDGDDQISAPAQRFGAGLARGRCRCCADARPSVSVRTGRATCRAAHRGFRARGLGDADSGAPARRRLAALCGNRADLSMRGGLRRLVG